jgi:hypothetical protein
MHFNPILIIEVMTGAYQNGAPYVTPLLWWALSLACKNLTGWKRMAVANTLAYYDVATITGVKFLWYRLQGAIYENFLRP